jgi:hypothetical protein
VIGDSRPTDRNIRWLVWGEPDDICSLDHYK